MKKTFLTIAIAIAAIQSAHAIGFVSVAAHPVAVSAHPAAVASHAATTSHAAAPAAHGTAPAAAKPAAVAPKAPAPVARPVPTTFPAVAAHASPAASCDDKKAGCKKAK